MDESPQSTGDGLRQALGIRRGITCVVGAGGKKSLLAALAFAHRSGDGRLALANSVRTRMPPIDAVDACVFAPEDAIEGQLRAAGGLRVAYGGPPFREDRCEGLPPALIADLHERFGFATTLVKADGARMRWIKAPDDDEPALVPGCVQIVPVLSLRALGRPLDEDVAHRPERIAAITGATPGSIIDDDLLLLVLFHPDGSLRGASNVRVTPLLTGLDAIDVTRAEAIAEAALAGCARIERIVLADLRRPHAPQWRSVRRAEGAG